MIATDDPRAAELLRRRAERDGAPTGAGTLRASPGGGLTPPSLPAPGKDPDPAPAAAGEPRTLDDAGKAEVARLARANPRWSASDLADAFEAEHSWRPSYQAIGPCLEAPAPRKGRGKGKGRGPGRPRAPVAPAAEGGGVSRPPGAARSGPAREVAAIAAVSTALAGLGPAEARRVLDWAGARFLREEGGGP